jgi:mannose/cellobiose epimerase-like protein (N-acyl-D-glucosamine 2-epimerase family)
MNKVMVVRLLRAGVHDIVPSFATAEEGAGLRRLLSAVPRWSFVPNATVQQGEVLWSWLMDHSVGNWCQELSAGGKLMATMAPRGPWS